MHSCCFLSRLPPFLCSRGSQAGPAPSHDGQRESVINNGRDGEGCCHRKEDERRIAQRAPMGAGEPQPDKVLKSSANGLTSGTQTNFFFLICSNGDNTVLYD